MARDEGGLKLSNGEFLGGMGAVKLVTLRFSRHVKIKIEYLKIN